MAKTRMPRDDNSQSIPVLRFREGGAQRISTLTSSSLQRIEVSEGVKVITVVATNPIFFGTGRSDVVATSSSHYLAANIPYDIALGSDMSSTTGYHTHFAAIAVSSTAIVYISERE
jgi:hypothetical protein